ncbi:MULTISPECIES: hypothetical protein [unclassified Staphylococcus]|uniref:hypothetical protein n=1 Tax=unclassified Staphylococcus TaxID=91994 RepID=UPI001AEBF6E3|nr:MULTISPECIES: hypothetical protein [unclassified Staphylococcus]
MAYENKIAIESCIKRVHEQQGTTEKVQKIINELETVYRKAKAFDEIKKRFEKEYKAEVLEESLYYPENFDNSEFLVDVEHILYFEDVRYVKIKEDK